MKRSAILFALFAAVATTFAAPKTPETLTLERRNEEFRQEVIQIAPNVYTASGYDASNISMIVGTDGVVLIDSGKFPENSAKVYEEFKKITDKPITGIIITHGHGDHTNGLPVFLKDNTPEIWAAENFGIEATFALDAGFKNPRSHHQSGMKVAPELRINNGVAPTVYPGGKFDKNDKETHSSLYVPFSRDVITGFVSDPVERVTISGITLELIRTDGETADHIVVYYPEEGVIFPGDQFYKSFPNLYAIRGTEYRDVQKWIEALNTILSYDAKAMAQGHTRPIVGQEEVRSALTAHRDAVKFVFDKSIEGMNMGMNPDQLVEYVKLPEPLASDPNLIEYYGRVDWAVRNIYNGYLGWYDGNPSNLCPLTPAEEAREFAELLGGVDVIEKGVRKALKKKKYQWAAELSDRLLALDPDNREYRELKATALDNLALNIVTATGRNYYNSTAQDLRAQ